MSSLRFFISKYSVITVIGAAILWLIVLLMFAGITTGVLKTEFGSSLVMFAAHIFMFICLLILLWRLGWLKASGIARPGKWQVWMMAVAGTLYSALTALFSFYGEWSFELSTVKNIPVSLDIIKSQIAVSLDEETFFRGLILYFLILNLGRTQKGIMWSVVLMSLIFGLMHVLWVFFSGLSGLSALFLALQTIIISVWWASFILAGGSIWPAFLAHFVVNPVISLQGMSHSILQPDHYAYGKNLLFTIPLGVIAVWLILRKGTAAHPIQKAGSRQSA